MWQFRTWAIIVLPPMAVVRRICCLPGTACCATGLISMNHYHATTDWYERRAALVSAGPGSFATFVQSVATWSRLRSPCFPSPDSFFALCFHFTGGLLYGEGCVCFIWTHRWPGWPQIMLKEEWEDRINLHHGRGEYLLRSFKAFANRGDPSRTFKMSHPGLVHLHNL